MKNTRSQLAVLLSVLLAGVLAYRGVQSVPASAETVIADVPFFSQTALKDAQTPDGKPANYTLGNSKILLWSDGCGVAALAMVFRYHGVETDLVGMNDRLISANAFYGALLDWSQPESLVTAGAPWIQAVKRINTAQPQDYRARVDTALAAGEPVIAFLNGEHYVVIVGKDETAAGIDQQYRINDPWAKDAAAGQAIALADNVLKKGGFDSIRQFVFVTRQAHTPTNGILVKPPISEHYIANFGATGELGNPVAAQEALPDMTGVWQRFERGAIFAPEGQAPRLISGRIWEFFQQNGSIAAFGLPQRDIYSYRAGDGAEWRVDLDDRALAWREGDPQVEQILSGKAYAAAYFSNRNLSGVPALTRFERDLQFDWRNGAPAAGVGADEFSARFTAPLPSLGVGWWHTFVAHTDGDIRIFVDGKSLLDTWRQPDAGHRVTAWLGPGDHQLTVEYAHAQDAAFLKLAVTPWPVTPVFAAESSVGASDQPPVSAAPFIDPPSAGPDVLPVNGNWWEQSQSGAQEWWMEQQQAIQEWWDARQAEMQRWWEDTQREMELAWQEWLDNLSREIQVGIEKAIKNMVAEFSRWVETQVQQFLVQTCGGAAAPGLVILMWVAYRRRR